VTGLSVKATQDIPEDTLQAFATSLRPRIAVTVDPSRAFFKSLGAPSWVKVLETPEFWILTFLGNVAWDSLKVAVTNRRAIAARVRAAAHTTLGAFIDALCDLATKLGEGTELYLGCPIPDDWFATVMLVRLAPAQAMEEDLAMFLLYLPAVERFLEGHQGELTGQVTLATCDDGAMLVSWMDRTTLTPQQTRLTLQDVA